MTRSEAGGSLPARRLDSHGVGRLDLRAVAALATPMVANSALQILLNLTDTWFVGRLSTAAVAAIGAAQWLIAVVIIVLGSNALAVQTGVAQAVGARCYVRSSRVVWTALWGVLLATPVFVAVGWSGSWILSPFELSPEVHALAVEFWLPRVSGAPFGVAAMAVLGFFNGIARPKVVLKCTIVMLVSNIALNQLFIVEWGYGIAASAWASTIAQALGLTTALSHFLSAHYRRQFRSHLVWRLDPSLIRRQFTFGVAIAVISAADLLAVAFFQLMQTRVSTTNGAVTQITLMLTTIAYLPAAGIALAGTTLVGQAVGAGERKWAMYVGTRIIAMAALVMGGLGLLLALAGPSIVPNFVSSNDPLAAAVISAGQQALWFAALYQFFDGLNVGSACCLRGAGDAKVPAAIVSALAWLVFMPLVHAFTFSAGHGWIPGLPQFGWGLAGGWSAMVIYMALLGSVLLLRWRTGVWTHAAPRRA